MNVSSPGTAAVAMLVMHGAGSFRSAKGRMRRIVLAACAAALVAVPLTPGGQRAEAQEPMLVPCLGLAADSSPVFPTDRFPDPTMEVSACFRLGADDSADKLSALFIAEDVGNAAPRNYTITRASMELNGQKTGRFWFENPRPMPVGAYRVEVSADGRRPWRSADFRIIRPSPQLLQTGDLMPLRPGRRWTYRFEQRTGAGAAIDMPDVEPDAGGVYRAKATIEVTNEEDGAFHLVTSRNGKPVFEEWWRPTDSGILALRRKDAEQLIELDPPQRLIGTARGDRLWTYAPFGQTFRMWGPFQMQGSWGARPGYVILVSQIAGPFTITAERHFVPDLGMTREIIVQALAGTMVSRQELELLKFEE